LSFDFPTDLDVPACLVPTAAERHQLFSLVSVKLSIRMMYASTYDETLLKNVTSSARKSCTVTSQRVWNEMNFTLQLLVTPGKNEFV